MQKQHRAGRSFCVVNEGVDLAVVAIDTCIRNVLISNVGHGIDYPC
jgi:hypothetical protein